MAQSLSYKGVKIMNDLFTIVITFYIGINVLIAFFSGVVTCLIHQFFCWNRYIVEKFNDAKPIGKVVIWIAFIPSILLEIPAMLFSIIVIFTEIVLKYIFSSRTFAEAIKDTFINLE